MAKHLLHRQISLLQYLTSRAAILGDRAPPHGSPPEGIDRGLLDLDARFSHAKRMQSIVAILPRTFAALGETRQRTVGDFIEACSPAGSGGLDDARRFHEFLAARRNCEGYQPYWCDVAACELAGIRACMAADQQEETKAKWMADVSPAPGRRVRRRPGVVLLQCEYDVRPCFEDASDGSTPVKRATALAMVASRDAGRPQAMELLPFVFDLLANSESWVSPAAFGAANGSALLSDLIAHRLVEVEA